MSEEDDIDPAPEMQADDAPPRPLSLYAQHFEGSMTRWLTPQVDQQSVGHIARRLTREYAGLHASAPNLANILITDRAPQLAALHALARDIHWPFVAPAEVGDSR